MSQNLQSFLFLTNSIFKLNNFHREHCRALSGHHEEGFMKKEIEPAEVDGLKDIAIVLYLKINENQWKINRNHMENRGTFQMYHNPRDVT